MPQPTWVMLPTICITLQLHPTHLLMATFSGIMHVISSCFHQHESEFSELKRTLQSPDINRLGCSEMPELQKKMCSWQTAATASCLSVNIFYTAINSYAFTVLLKTDINLIHNVNSINLTSILYCNWCYSVTYSTFKFFKHVSLHTFSFSIKLDVLFIKLI